MPVRVRTRFLVRPNRPCRSDSGRGEALRIAWAGPVQSARSFVWALTAKPPHSTTYLIYYRPRFCALVRKVVRVARIVCESPAFDVYSGFHLQRRLVHGLRLSMIPEVEGVGMAARGYRRATPAFGWP
jgi:hypothetical protein